MLGVFFYRMFFGAVRPACARLAQASSALHLYYCFQDRKIIAAAAHCWLLAAYLERVAATGQLQSRICPRRNGCCAKKLLWNRPSVWRPSLRFFGALSARLCRPLDLSGQSRKSPKPEVRQTLSPTRTNPRLPGYRAWCAQCTSTGSFSPISKTLPGNG